MERDFAVNLWVVGQSVDTITRPGRDLLRIMVRNSLFPNPPQ